MPKVYVNKGSKKLHYEGGCRFAESWSGSNEVFETQAEAKRKYGDAISICMTCQKKLDKQKSL